VPALAGKREAAMTLPIGSRPDESATRTRAWIGSHGGIVLMLSATLFAASCSPSRFVASSMGDALAEDSLVYAGDDDIELIGSATPFGLKTIETLLVEVPRHRGLLTAAARGFTQYAYVYVQLPADVLEEHDVAAAYDARERARRLYLRARDYGLRGLGFEDDEELARLRQDPGRALSNKKRADVETLYWTGVAWSAAVALGKDEPALIADLPVVDAIVARATALDPDFDQGGLHTFLISYEMGRPGRGAEAIEIANRHFQRAVELSSGERVAPFVAMAESVTVAEQQRQAFEDYLGQALAIDADARTEWRLANYVMQRRARWLLAHSDTYFLE
jgi:predicted anti-sigma-YlaC factor YlaD